jgi:hypothetical protein
MALEIEEQARALMTVALSLQVEDGQTDKVLILARALTVLQAACVGLAKLGGLSSEQFHRADVEMWESVVVRPDMESMN